MVNRQSELSRELANKLWAIANDLRNNMDSSKFKDYILGVIFYRYLSERTESYMNELLKKDGVTYREALKDAKLAPVVKEWAIEHLGYVIEPKYLFASFVNEIKANEFSIEHFEQAISELTASTIGQESESAFDKLFDDMNLQDKDLGKEVSQRTELISKVILKISDISFDISEQHVDILGTAYMILIGLFASDAGKKGGEFYSPECACTLVSKLATLGLNEVDSVCDPCAGSGSMLLQVQEQISTHDVTHFYAQELNGTTYNLLRMNLLMHGVPYKKFTTFNDDTLKKDNFGEEKFQIQVSNPPYSAKHTMGKSYESDPRYSAAGVLAPKSKADFAFVEHMVYHMADDGRIAVLLPHGALFRGDAEDIIRKYLIKNLNCIDAVIGLPANMFHGTGIPVCVMILKKNRNGNSDNICFIDASRDFEKANKMNLMTEEHIEKVVKAYKDRKNIDRYCYVANMDEIAANDYKLNILAFVKLNQIDENVNAVVASENLRKAQDELEMANKDLFSYIKELGLTEFTEEALIKVASGKLRFKDSNGNEFPEWRKISLGEVLTETKCKSNGELRICSVAVNEGVIDQIEHLGRSYAADDTSNYGCVKYGDVVYTKSPTGNFPFGIIKQSQLQEDVAVSPLYGIFKPKNYYLGLLLHYYFESPANANNYLAPIIQKGAKNTINISNETFLTGTLTLPMSEEEQKKIAQFIQAFDKKIKLEETIYLSWKNIKGGLLQQMFLNNTSSKEQN